MGNPPKRRVVVPTGPRPRLARNDRQSTRPEWMSGALVDAAIVIGATLATTLFLLLISGQLHDTTAGDMIAQSPAPVSGPMITGQPTPEPSSLVHSTPSPLLTRPAASPSPAPTENENAANVTDDATIQAAIDKKLQDNADVSSLNITATVNAGKVVVVGSVPSDELKEKVEKLLRSIKGVQQVDNQIAVVREN